MSFRKTSQFHPVLETLEDRLALSWSGVPPSYITPPANALAAALNSQGDAQGAASISYGEVDYYSFVAPASGYYRISASTPYSSLDTVLGVFSSGGARLAYNDDISSFNYDSQLWVHLSAGYRCYVGITNYTGSVLGSYVWAVDGPAISAGADDAYEDNDSIGQAYNLGTLTSARTISGLAIRDSDWFRFTTSGTGTSNNYVRIAFSHVRGDLDMVLYNSAGTLVGRSDGYSDSELISLNGRPAGTYYLHIYGYAGATNPTYSLSIVPPTGGGGGGGFDIVVSYNGLTSSQRTIFERAAARWERIIVGDLPNATYNGVTVDDLLIGASARYIDGAQGILGRAGPDRVRYGGLPYHGIMEFDSADMAQLESSGQLFNVIVHEMGHVLGIGTLWQSRNLLVGAGTSNPQFIGVRAVAEYNAIFGVRASGVPVENQGAQGTRDGHWRESVLRTELMTGYLNSEVAINPISRITVASLADLGYAVNMSAADPYSRPAALQLSSSPANSGSSLLLLANPETRKAAVPLPEALEMLFRRARPYQADELTALATTGRGRNPCAMCLYDPAAPSAEPRFANRDIRDGDWVHAWLPCSQERRTDPECFLKLEAHAT